MSEVKTERETKTLTTPGGKEFILKTYVTGREARQLQAIFLDKVSLKQTPEGQTMEGLKGSAAAEAEDLAVKLIVISFDGSEDDLINRILDLPNTDTDFIKKTINEVTSPKDDAEKKKL